GSAPLGRELNSEVVADDSLLPLYRAKNGFFAFESALLIRPWGGGPGSVEWWNDELGWRSAYAALSRHAICFAKDAFGFQFTLDGSGFFSFDPETAELEYLGKNVEDWAAAILDNADTLTGFPLAHQWQIVNGELPPGCRLASAVPFVLGGEYSVEALRAKPDIELASFRAHVYTQIKDLPDGASVNIRFE
ncbi:hypothetical protein, partial [Micromonospora sp. LOL_015]|uniref:hypothetical protein n=1 Tax=Micromonospora sp. LOL_015 TaxID=3345416 RepID=UPI003A8B542E